MSSHHFVRDGQEPALLIIESVPYDLAAPLLEWAPYVLVAEAALAQVSSWGIKIDAVMISSSPGPSSEVIIEQAAVEWATIPMTGNYLSKGIDFLASRSQEAATVLCQHPQKWMDHHSYSLPVVLLSENHRWSLIRSGHFEQWLMSGEKLWISALAGEFTVSGLADAGDFHVVEETGLVWVRSKAQFWVGQIAG